MRLGMVSCSVRRSSFAHGFRQRAKILSAPGTGQNIVHRGQAGGGVAIQKGGRFLRQSVLLSLLGQKLFPRQVLTSDAPAAFGSSGLRRVLLGRVSSLSILRANALF